MGHEIDPTCRAWECKGAYELSVSCLQLLHGQLWDKGHPIALLHEVHEGLQTPPAIAMGVMRIEAQMTELHQLIPEAMPLVQQPQVLLPHI